MNEWKKPNTFLPVCLYVRVVEMSGRCGEILLSSAKNKVSFYMQQALDEMNIHLETACSKYQGERGEGVEDETG